MASGTEELGMGRIIILLFLIWIIPTPLIANNIVLTGTTDVDDTDIYGSLSGSSFGGRGIFRVDNVSSVVSLVRFDVAGSSIPANATITNVKCSLYVFNARGQPGSDGNISAYRVFKPWVEGAHKFEVCTDGSTWLGWDCGQTSAPGWGTNGAACAQSDGIYNTDSSGTCTAADSTADRSSVAEETIAVDDIGWYVWDISPSLVQLWLDEGNNMGGLAFVGSSSVDKLFFSSDTTGFDSQEPRLGIDYTVPATGQKIMIKK